VRLDRARQWFSPSTSSPPACVAPIDEPPAPQNRSLNVNAAAEHLGEPPPISASPAA
jgi:hypothetical protein